MEQPIYFTKVEFFEYHTWLFSRLILNIPQRELSFQVFEKKDRMPSITGNDAPMIMDRELWWAHLRSSKRIKNEKTGFEWKMIPEEDRELKILYSYGKKISEKDMEALLPLCNAIEFEKYKKTYGEWDISLAYRDEYDLFFTGITDSYMPMMHYNMSQTRGPEIDPFERLYMYLIKNFMGKKKFMGMPVSE